MTSSFRRTNSSETFPKRSFALAFLVACALSIPLGVSLLRHFGVTWDFMQTAVYGERYLEFAKSLDPQYLDFSQPKIQYSRPYPITEPDPSRRVQVFSAPHFVWPVPYTLSALSARCLYLGTEWIDDPYASHYAINFVLAALLFAGLWWVLARYLNPTVALCTCVALATFPAFFSHLFNNLRDMPVAVFFSLSLLSLSKFMIEARTRSLGLYAFWLALALASKTNAILVPPIAILALLVHDRCRKVPLGQTLKRSAWIGLASASALLISLLLWPWMWPWLWEEPFLHLEQHIQFIRQVRDVQDGFDFTPVQEVIGTVPILTLGLGLLGLLSFRSWQRIGRLDLYFLALFWTLIPILRICLPRARNYGGVRHFLEFSPGFSILAGFGAYLLIHRCQSSSRRAALMAGLGLLSLWPIVSSFPDGTSRYNLLVGGIEGAREKKLSAAYDFWGNSYRRAVAWMNENSEKDSVALAPVGEHVLRMYRERTSEPSVFEEVWLRSDIQIVSPGEITDAPAYAGRTYVIELLREPGNPEIRAPWLTQALSSRKPAFEVHLSGSPLLRIYDLGLQAEATTWLSELDRSDLQDLEQRLPRILEAARENPNDVPKLLDAYRTLNRVEGQSAAVEFLKTLVSQVEDKVLRDRIWQLVVEESSSSQNPKEDRE